MIILENYKNQEEGNEDRLRQLKKDMQRKDLQLKQVCENNESERKFKVDRANKRIFSQQEKITELQIMDELLSEIDQKFTRKESYPF